MTCPGDMPPLVDSASPLLKSTASPSSSSAPPLKVVVLVVVAALELVLVLHRRFLDGQTLLYLDLGHAQLLLPTLLDLLRLLHLQLPLDDLMRKQVLHGHHRIFERGSHAEFRGGLEYLGVDGLDPGHGDIGGTDGSSSALGICYRR